MENPKVFLKLVDSFNGDKVPVLCDSNGNVFDGQRKLTVTADIDEIQTATVEFFVGWLKDDNINKAG